MERKFPKRLPHVGLRVFESGDRILVDMKKRRTYKINEIAFKIWCLCDGSHSLLDIVDAIVNEFDVGRNTAKNDCDEFLNKLVSWELIET